MSPGASCPTFHRSAWITTNGTDEATERRAVGAEDDRHVAGEIDRADRIGVVVDIRRMQPGLAAVAPRPLRLRADQAHAGAVGIVVDLPRRRSQIIAMSACVKKVRRAVRAVEHPDRPVVRDRGLHPDGQFDALGGSAGRGVR